MSNWSRECDSTLEQVGNLLFPSPRGPWHVSVTERPIELPPNFSREQRHGRTASFQTSSILQATSNRASEALARGSETDGTRFGSRNATAEGAPNRDRSPHRRMAFVAGTEATSVTESKAASVVGQHRGNGCWPLSDRQNGWWFLSLARWPPFANVICGELFTLEPMTGRGIIRSELQNPTD
jgi:hypothetical protein